MNQFVIITAKGLTELLVEELQNLNLSPVQRGQVVYLEGSLADGYKVCLYSRIASRVLMVLESFDARDEQALYDGISMLDWTRHFDAHQTFAIDFNERGTVLKNSKYGALKVKDAIVDQFNHRFDIRPSVDLDTPDVRISVLWQKQTVTVHLDLSGGSLSHRGYRLSRNQAPLRENLAAGLLMRARWSEIANSGQGLIDPMCGSGTLVIEAAMMAANIAPGLKRTHWGFDGWKGHDAKIWNVLLTQAQTDAAKGLEACEVRLAGYDVSHQSIEGAKDNAMRAGVDELILFTHQSIERLKKPRFAVGLVIVNPPYGERLGNVDQLKPLYQKLGEKLRTEFNQSQAAVLTSKEKLAFSIGLRAEKSHQFYNGALAVKLYRFDLPNAPDIKPIEEGPKTAVAYESFDATKIIGIDSFVNRVKKNLKHLNRWAKRNNIYAYRLYDADIPEFSLALDVFESIDGERYASVQEYIAPKTIDKRTAAGRLYGAMQVLPDLLGMDAAHIVLKRRTRQREGGQYELQGNIGEVIHIREGAGIFELNLFDYLDTGLFLDHRPMRRQLFEISRGKRVLNLFSYTSTASVHAALGGALETVSVDMSKTYLAWSKRNFIRNNLNLESHQLIHADCVSWLHSEIVQMKYGTHFDLIYIDPPTLSRSKRMNGQFDVQSAYAGLLDNALGLLNQEGTLLFSNNYRKFKFDYENKDFSAINEVSDHYLDEDFKRNPRIHRVWEMSK